MVFPYDSRSGRLVPLRQAQQLLEQRNQLLAEVQKLRRELHTSAEERQTLHAHIETLQRRASEAETIADELHVALAEKKDDREATEDSSEALSRLSRRIEELTADLTRLQRRSANEIDEARRQERARLLCGLGDVLDSIERGLQSSAPAAFRQGLEAIHGQFLAFLRAEGVTLLGEPGDEMNPDHHQAISVVDSDAFPSGTVAVVIRRGLALEDGTLVRPAQVAVVK